jgi:7-cyano-7-deazaguanine synthase
MHQRGSGRTCTLLLSGGIDSATLAAVLLARGAWQPTALFIDFGQRAAAAERESSHLIARHYGIGWVERRLAGGLAPPLGEVEGRNDMLVAVAAMLPADAVAIGTHAGTPYADSSPAHGDAWQRLLDVQHHGRKRLLAPLLRLTKHEVVALARDCDVPLALTRSCDDAGGPCGSCTSCLDRRHALAGA